MEQILIRADDLGFSDGVNQGIRKTLQNGLVKSVGLMSMMFVLASIQIFVLENL